jgi:hypothetical protein
MICEEQGARKRIQSPLLHSAKARYLAASIFTLRDHENKWLPLCTPASRITYRRLPIILLAPGERERDKKRRQTT